MFPSGSSIATERSCHAFCSLPVMTTSPHGSTAIPPAFGLKTPPRVTVRLQMSAPDWLILRMTQT